MFLEGKNVNMKAVPIDMVCKAMSNDFSLFVTSFDLYKIYTATLHSAKFVDGKFTRYKTKIKKQINEVDIYTLKRIEKEIEDSYY